MHHQLRPAPLPQATSGHLPSLVSPGGGTLANLARSRSRALANPGGYGLDKCQQTTEERDRANLV